MAIRDAIQSTHYQILWDFSSSAQQGSRPVIPQQDGNEDLTACSLQLWVDFYFKGQSYLKM